MWNLLYAEWQYNRSVLAVTGSFFLLLAVAYCLWGGPEARAGLRALRVLVIFCIAVVWLYQVLRRQKERIDRLQRILPVSQVHVGLYRVACLTGFWISLLVVFTGARLLSADTVNGAQLGRDVAAFSGIFFMANSITLISRDHRYSALSRFWMMLVRTVVALFLVSGYLLFALHGALQNELGSLLLGPGKVLRSVYYSVPGSLGLLTAGLLCSWLSVFVYIRRIDYRE